MKTNLYYKSEHDQIVNHAIPGFLQVEILAKSYDGSLDDILFHVHSELYDTETVKEKLTIDGYPGTWIDPVAAQVLGEELQPDRDVPDPMDLEGDPVPYHFTLADYQDHAALQQAAIDEIDAKSRELLAPGIDYNGHQLSLSGNAQNNHNSFYLKIMNDPDPDTNLLPRGWSKIDGGEYMIADVSTFKAIFKKASDRVEAVLDAGRALRLQVLAASTLAEIAAVEDLRT